MHILSVALIKIYLIQILDSQVYKNDCVLVPINNNITIECFLSIPTRETPTKYKHVLSLLMKSLYDRISP